MHVFSRLACVLAVLILAATTPAPAQNAHYWNKQYGNRAYLLGGAVIGSSNDVSAAYYNPALLTVSEKPNLTVAGNAFHATTITVTNALGEGLDLKSTSVGSLPSLVAGEIPIGNRRDQRLAYSLLFRYEFDFRLEQRGLTPINGLPGEAFVRGEIEESLNEIWSGLSYARRLDSGLSLGASVFMSYRTHRFREMALAEAEADDQFGLLSTRDDFDYYQVGVLAKLGVGGRSGAWSYGLTLTTPTHRLTGSGSTSLDRAAVIGALDGSQTTRLIVSGYESELRADHRTPLTLGAGAAFTIARTTLHVSAEWFAAMDPYRLLDAAPVVDDDTGLVFDADVVTGAASVVNWGVGLEHEFGQRVHGYASIHTDRSAARNDESHESPAIWDLWHAAGGVSLQFGASRVALGGVYGFGSAPLGWTPQVQADPDQGTPASLPQRIEAEYRSFLLLLGFGVEY